MKPRSILTYGALVIAWGLVVGWQAIEHYNFERDARGDKSYTVTQGHYITTSLGRIIRSQGLFWDTEIDRYSLRRSQVNSAVRDLAALPDVISIAIVNRQGDEVASAGASIPDLKSAFHQNHDQADPIWDDKNTNVLIFNLMDLDPSTNGMSGPARGAVVHPEFPPPAFNSSNFPGGPFPPPNNRFDDGVRRGEPGRGPETNGLDFGGTNLAIAARGPQEVPGGIGGERQDRGRLGGPGGGNPRGPRGARLGRPPWVTLERYVEIADKNELFGFGIVLSSAFTLSIINEDFHHRVMFSAFAFATAVGLGLAFGYSNRSANLEMRLLRASEMNTHLREMNLAAAGLAHETRNPLNIVRGLAQMISKTSGESSSIRNKALEITEEVDRVSAQLNEYINYSKPREVRRTPVPLSNIFTDVIRALQSDLDHKQIILHRVDEELNIEADQQMLRQILFNLILNAIQAVDVRGEIQIASGKTNQNEAWFEIRDNGPGVAAEFREEIFRPYFTTRAEGTGLGLAVVRQMAQAHDWNIVCLPNNDRGAIFRVSHLKRVFKV